MATRKSTKTKTTKTPKAASKASIKRNEEILHYRRALDENESRLATKTNAKGEPLSPTQVTTLQEVIGKQHARLDELVGE